MARQEEEYEEVQEGDDAIMKSKIALSIVLIALLAGFASATLSTPTHIDIQKLSTSSDGSTVSVGIWWDSVPNATGYNLYQSTDNTTFYLMYKNISSTSITIMLDNGTTYYFKLTAINATEESAPTPVFWINTTTGEVNVQHYVPPPGNGTKSYSPALPSITTMSLDHEIYDGNDSVHLHFELNESLTAGESINIYRSTDDENFTWVALQGQGDSTNKIWDFYDTDIQDNQTYYYYALVENSTSYGPRTDTYYINLSSNQTGKIEKLLTPTLESVKEITINGNAAVLLDWSPVKLAVSYEVYRSENLTGPWIKLNETYYQNSTNGYVELIDTYNLQNNKTYYYYIIAVGPNGEKSYQSNIMWVNIKTGETGVIPVGTGTWIMVAATNNYAWVVVLILIVVLVFILHIAYKKRRLKR